MTYISIIIAVILFGIYYRLGRIADKQPFRPNVPALWDGPESPIEERQQTWQWLVEFFKYYPNSGLKDKYPELHKTAMASKRYDELETLRQSGKIDEIDYQIELEKILPLISLNDTTT